MAKEITSLAELEREVKRRINACLRDDVAPLIKQEISKAVDDVVYAAGEPVLYDRRKAKFGLQDEENMPIEVNDCSVSVYERAEATGENFEPLAENLEYGYGKQDTWYKKPRPFMDTAQEYVNRRANDIQRIVHSAIKHGN